MSLRETKSKMGVKIRLSQPRWNHILSKHPEMEDQMEYISQTLESPDTVYFVPSRDNYHYYRLFPDTPVKYDKHLSVIARHLNEEGFVITAYYTSRINEKGKVKHYEKENVH